MGNSFKKASNNLLVFFYFYPQLAFEGFHYTQCYTTDIASNPIETIKYSEYNRYARTSSKD